MPCRQLKLTIYKKKEGWGKTKWVWKRKEKKM